MLSDKIFTLNYNEKIKKNSILNEFSEKRSFSNICKKSKKKSKFFSSILIMSFHKIRQLKNCFFCGGAGGGTFPILL